MADDIEFLRAGPEQTTEVLAVLDEAAAWLRSRGVDQWPARFEAAWIEPGIAQGDTWIVRTGGRTAATVTLDWFDPVWSDHPGPAGYLHRLAVRRHAAGLGARILDWAAATLAHTGRHLRLDCLAANTALRAYYESAGFTHRGDTRVGGAPGQRRHDGPATLVSRYEKPLA
ncbi:GNAT family N-acetyltransferase [Peterkaempfera bronchialis]|uniref:GNAT family N-acetyltransferase n=1 Tax=Peterkaempfera bronchialis TaxID=2126346 RepID=A0A345T240_9ACTN|nr:GNAT family N-acetyltransferase [Peterkaempfera bronchialis]AXI80045.1 GNAT family N-acetyltransferase [Peterkaempfera bronchialis]